MNNTHTSKASLAITLSKLKQFNEPNDADEQYSTDSEIAADILWTAYMQQDINSSKKIVDLGCGTGILAIGAALLGAKVVGIEKDNKAVVVAKKNAKEYAEGRDIQFMQGDIQETTITADVVIQNPPFGTRKKHADMLFVEKAITIASKVYSFHKTTTIAYLKKYAEKNSLDIVVIKEYNFPLKATYSFHKKKQQHIKVSAVMFARKNTQ